MRRYISQPATEKRVTVVSTHTRDIFTEPDGRTWSVPGGPARYIVEGFQRLRVDCTLISGAIAESHVIVSARGEEYRIDAIDPIPLPDRIDSAAVVLSPIVREIDPFTLPAMSGTVIVDLQGFVREPGVSSACVDSRFDLVPLFERADVVKASEAELSRLTDRSRYALDSCILLTTLGHEGARVCVSGEEHLVEARPIRTAHTVGAGDTFLAGFVAGLLADEDPVVAAMHAARFTEEVLRTRG